jgi:hypothetical protein
MSHAVGPVVHLRDAWSRREVLHLAGLGGLGFAGRSLGAAPIATTVPGLDLSELLPLTAQQADTLCLLRAMSTVDNAHSSSGYSMLTGRPRPLSRGQALHAIL